MSDDNIELTQSQLKEILHYNQSSGIFTNISTMNIIGTLNKGYMNYNIDGKLYFLHRLAFLYIEGQFPDHHVDHINNIKTDNAWVNLRTSTHQQNMMNRKIQLNNTSGYKGVYFDKRCSKWHVRLGLNNKRISLGYFNCKHEAAKVYNKAALKYFGEFSYLNDVK